MFSKFENISCDLALKAPVEN